MFQKPIVEPADVAMPRELVDHATTLAFDQPLGKAVLFHKSCANAGDTDSYVETKGEPWQPE